MALIGIWYTNFFGAKLKPFFLMINICIGLPLIFNRAIWKAMAKVVDRNGETVDYSTGPLSGANPAPMANMHFTN